MTLHKGKERRFLFDMDGTTVDYDGPLERAMNEIKHHDEPPYSAGFRQNEPPHIKARRRMKEPLSRRFNRNPESNTFFLLFSFFDHF